MKPSSAKAKGRTLQASVRDRILSAFPGLTHLDVRSTAMGQAGVDILLSSAALAVFPFDVECKNVERLNFWQAWSQARLNAQNADALLVIKRNKQLPVVALDFEVFMGLVERSSEGRT